MRAVQGLYEQKKQRNALLQIDNQLHQWYEDVEIADVYELLSFKSMVESNEEIIRNYFLSGETNAMAEAINSQIQQFVTSNSGNRDKVFFYFRVGLYFPSSSK